MRRANIPPQSALSRGDPVSRAWDGRSAWGALMEAAAEEQVWDACPEWAPWGVTADRDKSAPVLGGGACTSPSVPCRVVLCSFLCRLAAACPSSEDVAPNASADQVCC